MHSGLVGITASFLGGLASLDAQLVTPKTVPIHQDNQFAIFPAARAGMANVSIALDDTLADPFVNPAKAAGAGGLIFIAPYTHGITAGVGGGNTLPVGGMMSGSDWAGAAVFAVQELQHGPGNAVSDRTAANQYGDVVLARRLGHGLVLGASAYRAGLNAVDGIDLLYAGSDRIVQSGTLTDLRLGLTKEWETRRWELLFLSNRTHLTQDVHYTTYFYPPGPGVITTDHTDHDIDQTNVLGIHTQYVQAVGRGWRVGWLATANRLSEPEIPNYQIQNIPRDPGTTYGFNVGVGAARIIGGTSFGVDLVEEPMYGNTYGTAAADTAVIGAASVLHAGDHTVDNHFTFTNAKIRVGVGHDISLGRDSSDLLGFQLGLGVYAINYRLRQTNHVFASERVQDEGWTEWTPTLGVHWRTKDFELEYSYSRTCGPSDCASLTSDRVVVPAPAVSTGGVIAAPSSPLTIDGGTAHLHRVTVRVPIA